MVRYRPTSLSLNTLASARAPAVTKPRARRASSYARGIVARRGGASLHHAGGSAVAHWGRGGQPYFQPAEHGAVGDCPPGKRAPGSCTGRMCRRLRMAISGVHVRAPLIMRNPFRIRLLSISCVNGKWRF